MSDGPEKQRQMLPCGCVQAADAEDTSARQSAGGRRCAAALMVQGTASSVGKSLIVTGLCRLFARRGIRVAPFKSQNMALNSFATQDGLEIGRAQAVQAEAAGVEPTVMMNPILLKPGSDHTSQVIVMGRVRAVMDAREYYRRKSEFLPEVRAAFARLRREYALIVLEGAGSPAEINLLEGDFVNMGMADMADCPVILVGDIDRGGVFASLYGTVMLLPESQRARIKGYIINKFRGDVSILQPGIEQLSGMLGIPCLGVVPYRKLAVEEEDSLAPELSAQNGMAPATAAAGGVTLDVAVLRLPRIANFTDFAPLSAVPSVAVRYVEEARQLGRPHLLIIPGSKSTMADLVFMQESGLAAALTRYAGEGGLVMGICGGYQMLGRTLCDPEHMESPQDRMDGLGLLDVETLFTPRKRTVQSQVMVGCAGARLPAQGQIQQGEAVSNNSFGSPPMHCSTGAGEHDVDNGLLAGLTGMTLAGYEIHMGESVYGPSSRPFARLIGDGTSVRYDGAVSKDGCVFGTYLHGIFENFAFTKQLLDNVRSRVLDNGTAGEAQDTIVANDAWDSSGNSGHNEYAARKAAAFDAAADLLEEYLDMGLLERIMNSEHL